MAEISFKRIKEFACIRPCDSFSGITSKKKSKRPGKSINETNRSGKLCGKYLRIHCTMLFTFYVQHFP